MNVGYVRVSTIDQNEARQVEALEKYGIEKLFREKISGKDTNRPELQRMLDYVREGDTVYVLDFSRLSRSTADLLSIVETLKEKEVRLISLKESLDTDTPQGKLMLTMIAAINEFERLNMLERQKEGVEIAKQQGKYKGRKPKLLENWDTVYDQWSEGKITAVKACEELGISRSAFYMRVKQSERE